MSLVKSHSKLIELITLGRLLKHFVNTFSPLGDVFSRESYMGLNQHSLRVLSTANEIQSNM